MFPGGELAHVSQVIEGMARAGPRGASTPRRCASTTRGRSGTGSSGSRRTPTLRAAEVGEERFRVWRIYMAGSAHAFDRGWLSLWQLLAGKPHGRRPAAASADARLHVPAERRRGCNGRLRPQLHSAQRARRACRRTTPDGRHHSPYPAAPNRQSALEFPCAFPIKIMGRTQDGFAQAIVDVVLQARAGLRSRRRSRCARRRPATGCR